jgi:hypothetical protein
MGKDSPDPRLDALVLDLVEWVASEPRPYAEVMDAWRTSCPRLAVWEEAVDRGLVVSAPTPQNGVLVSATPAGRELLEKRARQRAPQPAQNARASMPST